MTESMSDLVTLIVGAVVSVVVPISTYLGVRSNNAAAQKTEKTKAAVAVSTADVSGAYSLAEKRLQTEVERDKIEKTGTVDITRLAFESANSSRLFAEGVVASLKSCEDRSRIAETEHNKEITAVTERFSLMITDISARYEQILTSTRSQYEVLLTNAREESNRRDANTRAEVQLLIEHGSAIEATFQATIQERESIRRAFDEYRIKHPSNPQMVSVKPAK
jgi:hypothetical protein